MKLGHQGHFKDSIIAIITYIGCVKDDVVFPSIPINCTMVIVAYAPDRCPDEKKNANNKLVLQTEPT